MNDPIIVDLSLDAPLSRVWKAWTTSDEVARWFAEEANVVAERGGPYELFWDPEDHRHDGTFGCRITVLQPERWLGFTWRGPRQFAGVMNEDADPPPVPTHVMVHFEPDGTGTRLHLCHEGWGAGTAWQAARAWHVKAWSAVCGNLAAYVQGREVPFNWKEIRKRRQDSPTAA